MSKIYDKYLELKKIDESKMYLFKCGNFYIFLDDDATKINEYVVLKITNFAKNVTKCGFPITSLESYMKVFKNQNLKIEIVDETKYLTDNEKANKIIKKLKNIKVEEITPINAIVELSKLKEIADGL